MGWSIFKYDNNFVETTKLLINSIPCLKFKPKSKSDVLLPTLIYYHGWHSSKEFKRFEAMTFASFGFQVIVPDALYHGDRDPIDHSNMDNLDKYLWSIITQSLNESSSLIDTLIKEHNADESRIAVMGSSMGAITAGGVFVKNTNLKCLVGFNGTFAFEEAINKTHLPSKNLNKEFIDKYDPLKNIDCIKDRALLILHGSMDTSLPIETQKLFYDKVIPYYTNMNLIKFEETSGVDHKITSGMVEDAVTFFMKNL